MGDRRYGRGRAGERHLENNCLIARGYERAPACQIMPAGWDQHGKIFTQLESSAAIRCEKRSAGLDLKEPAC